MNEHSQRELDDELLSAYLDDELSADERALVERRLADDPEARQTLDQLRSGSQAVRNLPRKTPGRDIRESILQRIEAAKHATAQSTASSEPVELVPAIPKITIGRTARGWAWASLAVAAALLIMILQPGDQQELRHGGIAQRSDETLGEEAKVAREAPEMRAWNAPPQTARGGAATDAGAPAPASSELDGAPAEPAEAPVGQVAAEGKPAEVQLHAAPSTDSVAFSPRDTVDDLESSDVKATAADDELVVVHVLTKRAALENKSFDKLLASNGIQVEPETRTQEAVTAPIAGRASTSGSQDDWSVTESLGAAAGCELVLVEAPPKAIYSCMQELNRDSSNYLGLSVDDANAADEALSLKSARVKKLAADLGKYNRGQVAQKYKDAFVRDKTAYFYQLAEPSGVGGVAEEFSGRAAVAELKQHADRLARKSEMDRGRARRVQPSIIEGRAEPVARGTYRPQFGAAPAARALSERAPVPDLARRLESEAAADDQNWQVLFVLCPDDQTPPSAPPANQSE